MKKALLILTLLSGALLLGTYPATAAPPTPLDPPEILTPAQPPDPQPCAKRRIPCDFTLPTVAPDVTDPSEPAEPPTTTTTVSTTEAPAAGPRTEKKKDTTTSVEPASTATSVAAAAGPADTATPVTPAGQLDANWWLVTIPVVALLALAAMGAFLIIQRTERHPV